MSHPVKLSSPLMVALDVDRLEQAEALIEELSDVVGCFKLGPRLIHRYGEAFVRKVAKSAPVFVDCKFFDIPSTMEAAVRTAFDAGASFATIHAMAGPTALRRLAELEGRLNEERPFQILCVSILTSWDEKEFSANFIQKPVLEHVQILAAQARDAGLKGLVCSPLELDVLKGQGHFLVTPGVRLSGDSTDDQTRILAPQDALAAGASAFVVGRPIVQAANPREMALEYAVQAL